MAAEPDNHVTKQIVRQNITMAMVVKVLVLGPGACGIAIWWEVVMADVGVALLAKTQRI